MGIMNSLKISLQLYRNRYTAPKPSHLPELNAKQKGWLHDLRTNGVAVIPGYFSKEECAYMRNLLDTRIEDFKQNHQHDVDAKPPKFGWPTPHGYDVWFDRHQSDYRIVKAEKMDALVARFHNDPELVAVGAHYLNADLKVKHTMATRVQFKEANLGSGGGWHRDMVYRRGFKGMIYLTDVDTHTGPFQYIPHSDNASYHLFKSNTPEQYQFSHEEVMQILGGDASHIKEAIASEGTLLLFETNMIHRGKPIVAGHTRYAMTNYHNL